MRVICWPIFVKKKAAIVAKAATGIKSKIIGARTAHRAVYAKAIAATKVIGFTCIVVGGPSVAAWKLWPPPVTDIPSLSREIQPETIMSEEQPTKVPEPSTFMLLATPCVLVFLVVKGSRKT